ncbi:hypothetical protein F4804DRAFT_117502 [Jackrogersella minutella]|nr:hypothetical protein F4804DRAFT_117502 [Jackrogersella minutella]
MKVPASLSVVALLLPLAAADCDDFAFTGDKGNEGFTTTYNTTFQTSSYTNCTADLASQDGGKNNTCQLGSTTSIGLVAHPEVRFVSVDSKTQKEILAKVQSMANAASAASTNFNSTIVMNFTRGLNELSVGQAGYAGFTPFMNCFQGVLSDCDDDDGLEGKTIQACGLKWLDQSGTLQSQGKQIYDGKEAFVSADNVTGNSPPSYNSVSGQATNYQGDDDDDDNSAARSPVSSVALLFALLCSAYGMVI